jgi:hypothetical protein
MNRLLPDLPCRKTFCKLTIERKTGTPAFQKTGAKKIKKIVILFSFLNSF